MKFILFFVTAIILCAYAEVVSIDEIIRAYEISNNEIGQHSTKEATQALYVPMTLRSCSDGACNFLCKFLGFNHGTCISAATCRCYS